MEAKGSKLLKVAGILEILIGVASIAFTMWVLSQDLSKYNLVAFGVEITKGSILGIALVYGISAFQIVAGIRAILYANRPEKAKGCVIVAFILVILAIATIPGGDLTFTSILSSAIPLIVPCIYMAGAMANKKQ